MAEVLRSSDSGMNRVEQKKFLVDKFPGTQIVHIGESEETVITFDGGARLEIHWPSVETRNNLGISVFFPLPSEIAKIIGEPADIFISLPHDAELEDALRAVFLGDDNKDKSFLENHPWSAGLNGPHRINPIHDLWVKKAKQLLPRPLSPYLKQEGREKLIDELMGEKPKVKGPNKNLLKRLGIKDVPGLIEAIKAKK